jgi:glycosyltransferase involved in cell wall biosynthesis
VLGLNNSSLYVVMPTTRGAKAFPSIHSALKQKGFSSVKVLICGKSANDEFFISECGRNFDDSVFILPCVNKERVLPGEARNIGLDYIAARQLPRDYLLFLDDDIYLPSDYALKLKEFLASFGQVAAMGKIVSKPVNIWSKIIDYSNFWWLQLEHDRPDLGWLGTGATLIECRYATAIRFRPDVAVNEDVIFFARIEKMSGKHLGICTNTTCYHCHNRGSFWGLLQYQFNNGRRGVNFRLERTNAVYASYKRWRSFSKTAIKANFKYLKRNKIIIAGILFSFLVFELGAVFGTFSSIEKNKRRDKR